MANNLKISPKGLVELAGHEGIVTSRYTDSVGVWTIGIGHTAAAGAPDPETYTGTMSMEDILKLFFSDLTSYEAAVNKAFTRDLTQNEFDAAVSFDYNTGAIATATWVKDFNAGDDEAAKSAIMNWDQPSAIIPRRQAEQTLFFDGKYSGGGKVTVYTASSSGSVDWGSGKIVTLDGEQLAQSRSSGASGQGNDPAPTPSSNGGSDAQENSGGIVKGITNIFKKIGNFFKG